MMSARNEALPAGSAAHEMPTAQHRGRVDSCPGEFNWQSVKQIDGWADGLTCRRSVVPRQCSLQRRDITLRCCLAAAAACQTD
jgi:hypothetical protein